MEKIVLEKDRVSNNSIDIENSKSSEDFQKFVYDLFEKNGVLSDLRSYLRGQIINVLKSVNTGDPLMCQKHFLQRLEYTYQALNILIVEYLLRMDFNYSLSVFISEIPLANMRFDLAASLLGSTTDAYKELKFKDNDVWCVLNCLGIKCDSETASNIVGMYKKEQNNPLLLCILQNLPLHQQQPDTFEAVNTSEASISSSSWVSSISLTKCSKKSTLCKHYSYCDSCKQRISRFRKKYKKKKELMYQDAKESSLEQIKIESLLKNVDVMERTIIEEMFEQLKSVYETEVEMVKEEEERKIKRSLANHALLYQKRYDEMEETFKAREAELESNIRQKKKFLWGLARALRQQHSNMSTAMSAVQIENERLNAKEDNLRKQIGEVEKMLKQRGEEMKSQISSEVIVLESRLNTMRNERDVIEKERSDLEKLKQLCDSNTKMGLDNLKERDELNSRCNLLGEQLLLVKKQLSLAKGEAKCFVDKGVMTERKGEFSATMNNEQELERNYRSDETVRTPNQLVNDLKKQKNVNYNQAHFEEIASDLSRERTRAGAIDTSSGRDRHIEMILREENERLKTFADQQREHIDELTREHIRLRSELVAARMVSPRPRTAPALMPTAQGVNPSGARTATGLRRGAGEELSVFAPPRARVPVPGDAVPFVGALDRRAETRRQLMKQWRSLKSRFAPAGSTIKAAAVRAGTSRQDDLVQTSSPRPPSPEIGESAEMVLNSSPSNTTNCNVPQTAEENNKREKSPKSFLREAKLKLRSKDSIKQQPSVTSREKSPNSMLREAKLRLRKLEIEAEAVEKSFLDFRRRRSEMKNEELLFANDVLTLEDKGKTFNAQPSSSIQNKHDHEKPKDINMHSQTIEDCIKNDLDKYLRVYQTKKQPKPNVENKTAVITNPIPNAYLNIPQGVEETLRNVNYLETPLNEFRKLYHNPRPRHSANSLLQPNALNSYQVKKEAEDHNEIATNATVANEKPADNDETNEFASAAVNKIKELKILKDRLSEMYASDDVIPCKEQIHNSGRTESVVKNTDDVNNLLKIEVENVTEMTNVKIDSRDDLVIMVESSIDSRDLKGTDDINNYVPTVVISPKFDVLKRLDDKNADPEVKSNVTTSPRYTKSPAGDEVNYKTMSPPEEAAHLTRNDVLNAIFDPEADHISSADADLDNTKESLGLTDIGDGAGEPTDYADEFLADVDNYNSRSEDDNSPVSLAKTSEEDNFWD